MKKQICTVLFALTLPLLSHATEEIEALQSIEVDMETIEVVGQKPLYLLSKEFTEKRIAFIDFFNDAIEDDDLKIECKRQIHKSGSTIKKRICAGAYERRIKRELLHQQFMLQGPQKDLVAAASDATIGSPELKQRKQDLINEVNLLIKTNEAFREKFTEFKIAEELYKRAHIEKWGRFSRYAREFKERETATESE